MIGLFQLDRFLSRVSTLCLLKGSQLIILDVEFLTVFLDGMRRFTGEEITSSRSTLLRLKSEDESVLTAESKPNPFTNELKLFALLGRWACYEAS